jgi:hypothetical protein
MKLVVLTYFILGVNAAVDSGKYRDVSIAEVEQHIEGGDVLPWLQERLGRGIDLSLLLSPGWDAAARNLTEHLQDILGGYKGRERRKWGITNSGLCLLVAWTNEIIQQGRFESPAGRDAAHEQWLKRQLEGLDEPPASGSPED